MLIRSDKHLIIGIKDSLFLASIFVVLGVGAVLVMVPLSLPYGIGFGLAGVVLVSSFHWLCLHALGCSRNAIRRLKLESSGACAMAHGATDPWQDGRVVGWFVQPWLVMLRVQAAESGRQWDVLVAWDAVPENLFRELRVLAYGLRRAVEA